MRIIRRALREPFAARAWSELAYSLLSLPLALIGIVAALLVTVFSLLSTGVVAIPLLFLFLGLARGLGTLYRGLARVLLHLDIPAPERLRRAPGVLGWLLYQVADPVSWRVAGYLTVRFPLGLLQFVLGFAWWTYGAIFALYPTIWRFEAAGTGNGHSGRHIGLQLGDQYADTWPRALGVTAFGLLILLAWPWVQRLPLALDRWLMPRLLGPSETSVRLARVTETRELAVNEAAAALRRIERDLHDGAQARLIALGMRLSRAEARLGTGDTELALALVRESRRETREIVQELRELVRGIHPPALDSGLGPALATLAARCPLPTSLRVELPERPAPAVETMLYFAVAELLTNAAKHSGAGRIAVTVLSAGDSLRLLVTDDGVGGARLDGAGSGLRGLSERVAIADGELRVDSPPGGPTTIGVEIRR
ncbi:sensor histidine kinase [Streptacidiphilus sp. EB129]|uniref:sensor histidine kinase n=1 Tax=Streptacidiphilus sp. EB129 TaxID=3156262 RepID=UPI003518669C